MSSEREMLDLLAKRYTSIRPGTIADRWVRAEHVASTLGHNLKRVADFIAADRYPGLPYGSTLALHGHEVKVSRSDWLNELRDPSKAEKFKQYMHHWWLVVPDASIVKQGELPEGWGLLVAQSNGQLRAKVKAPRLEPQPMPLDLSISFAAAAARTAHRAPLRSESPSVFMGVREGHRCAWCGEPAPCRHHQISRFDHEAQQSTEMIGEFTHV